MQLSKQAKNFSIESDELDLGLIEVLSPLKAEESESIKFNLLHSPRPTKVRPDAHSSANKKF